MLWRKTIVLWRDSVIVLSGYVHWRCGGMMRYAIAQHGAMVRLPCGAIVLLCDV